MARVTQIDRLKRQCHLEEAAELGYRVRVIVAAAGDSEDYVIIAETGRVSEPVQRVGHRFTTSARSGAGWLLMRPSPTFVLARSRLYPSLSRIGATIASSPAPSQRVPTPNATTVSMRFSTSHTSRIISSVRSTAVLISTIAESSFSLRISSRKVPVDTSVIKDVTGFFRSKLTPALAKAQHISWMS